MAMYNAIDLIELVKKAVDKAGVELGFNGFCTLEKEIGLPQGWLTNLYHDALCAERKGDFVVKRYELVTALIDYVGD
ncbi:hypothetical protein [Pedobacter sp.]